jgi:Uma2 family endonuclease
MHDTSFDSTPVTAGDLSRMPDGGARRFLVRGRVVEQPYRTAEPGCVAATFCASLGFHAQTFGLGDVFASGTGFHISHSPDTVLAPAVAFVRRGCGEIGDGYHPGVPDLAVEVVSRLDAPAVADEFVAEWLTAGCPLVVVVDTCTGTVSVHRPGCSRMNLTAEDVIDGGDVVPGWRLPLAELFS